MSLADQSHQFYPTSVQVTVHQARNLRTKGKNGTNDAYAIIQVAKDKFSTSVDERCIAPVWKEEASFELPLFHPNNAERCRLNVIVMHRAQVGLDKFLGQAVINLLNLQDQKLSKKTDWFPLLDKSGKDDKARGEVLLDIQFLRNNMSASMFDLSMQDKPRSRISKIKDKVRGKKRDGFSDSASAIVPHVSSIVSDSEGEADAQSLNQFPGAKKKSKLQKLFAPKSNLHKNISQSMSTLGSQPSKDSSLSGSRSSGLNVDSPEVKKKFKFLGHKRTGSNDSKASQGPFSQGPFSLLGRHKQSASDVNSVCINGSHVYAEEAEPKTGSTLSLNSSGQGSVEDFHTLNSQYSMDSIKGSSAASSRQEEVPEQSNRQEQEGQEEEERRQAAEKRRAEDLRLAQGEEEERGHRQSEGRRLQELEEQRRYREEQEKRQRLLEEEEARRRKKIMDEEERQRGEERRMLQAMDEAKNEEENRREEAQKAEEKKRQDEASMSERLSTLFGISRRKEEKKEEAQPEREEPVAARGLELHASQTSNPFEEISLSPEAPNHFEEAPPPKTVRSPQTLSAGVFLNRTAKVSAVKPRPHPVKPMSSAENQFPSGSPAVKDIRILDTKAAHIKAEVLAEGAGAYTQLTQEELITLVVKQQLELTKRKNKIAELEEYIDNLLVRVIDEKPSILLGISSSKPA